MVAAEDWSQRVTNAAQDVAGAARDEGLTGSVREALGRMLILLGRAAGHADRIAGSGKAADTARFHFRAELVQVGALALEVLQESWRRQDRPQRDNQAVTHAIARERVLSARALESQGHTAPAGHAAAGLGAAIAAIGRAVQSVSLDDDQLPELDEPLESVLAHAIAAVARA